MGFAPNIPAGIAALDVGFKQIFQEGYADDNQIWLEKLAWVTPSTHLEELYGWFERQMKLRKWLGPRVARSILANLYRLKNEKYEGTIGIDIDKLEDSTTINVEAQASRELGRASRKWPQQLVRAALQAGTTGLGYDGKAFFASDHPMGGGQSNTFTTMALNRANLDTVVTAMSSLVDPTGEPLAEHYDTLIVPTALASTARVLMNSDTISDYVSGSSVTAPIANPFKGRFNVLELPELGNQPTIWYLAALSDAIKPLIFQMRKKPDQIVAKVQPDDPNVFELDEAQWGVKGRGAAGYGPWWKMARAAA